MTIDYYEEAAKIANELKKEGFVNEANAINDAVTLGYNVTEILGELSCSLEKCIKEEKVQKSELIESIKLLKKEIETVLGNR